MSKVGKRAFLLLLAIPIVINVMAQETKKPTLEDLIPGGESYRYAENLYGLTSVLNPASTPSILSSRKQAKKQCSSPVSKSTTRLQKTRQESYPICIPYVSHGRKSRKCY